MRRPLPARARGSGGYRQPRTIASRSRTPLPAAEHSHTSSSSANDEAAQSGGFMRRLISSCLLAVVFTSVVGVCALSAQTAQTQPPLREPDVVYVPTPPEVVEAMLKVAKVGPNDVVYDLGSGDGRIVISAVKDFGAARGVGIDINPVRIREANENAQKAGVADKVRFMNADLFTTDISDATVVTLYLLPSLN